MEQELKKIKINFSELENYTDPKTGFPLLSFVGVYEKLGIIDFIAQYYKENGIDKETYSYCDILFANPETILKIRRLVKGNWESYDITIDRDNHVIWKEKSNYGKSRHYAKRLTKVCSHAVDRDFIDCCPGADSSLADDEISITLPEDKAVNTETAVN